MLLEGIEGGLSGRTRLWLFVRAGYQRLAYAAEVLSRSSY